MQMRWTPGRRLQMEVHLQLQRLPSARSCILTLFDAKCRVTKGLHGGDAFFRDSLPASAFVTSLSLITISSSHLIMSSYISSGHLHGFGGRTPAIQTPSSSWSKGDYCMSRRCEIPEWRDRRRGEDQTSTLPTSSLQVPCNPFITRFVSLFHPPNVRVKIEDSRVECLGGKPAGTID